MADKVQFFTPVGRFVSGDLVTKRDKDHQNRPIAPDKQTYQFGLAIRKDDPGVGPLIQLFANTAYQYYQSKAPHVAQKVVNWMQTFDGFSMKVTDGDAPNQKGQKNVNTAGCYVFWFSTGLDIIGSIAPSNAQIPVSQIKRGWYIDVAGSCAANELTDDNAGIYLNPTVVRLIAEGDEIVGSVDPQQVFAQHAAPAALPPGARPLGSAPQPGQGAGLPGTGMVPGVGGAPSIGGMPGQQQMQPGFPGGAPVMPGTGQQAAGAPGGMQGFPGAGLPGGSTVSPTNTGFPQYPGILGQPQQ
jgi:hypothetical protein